MYNALSKIWVRIIISLFGGGMVSEFFHVSYGNNAISRSPILMWGGFFITFSILSIVFWVMKYWSYFFPKEENEDILDKD